MRASVKRPGALVLLAGLLLLAGCAQRWPRTSRRRARRSPKASGRPWPPGSYNTLALKQDGTLWAWGLNDYGQLGRGTEDSTAHATPRKVGHANDWVAVAGGYADFFALKKDGTLWAWGNNSDWGATSASVAPS